MKYFKKLVGKRIYLSPKGSSEEEIEKFTKNQETKKKHIKI